MKTILVLTDFSSAAKNAELYAAALAKEFRANIFLFHAFAIPIPTIDMPLVAMDIKEMESINKKLLLKEAIALEKKYKVKITVQTSAGFATEEAMQASKKLKPDLIVMGMKGKSNIAKILIGSTVIDVIQKSIIPVLVIPEKAKFKKPEKILLACDYKMPVSAKTLFPLKELAQKFHSEIYVVNVTSEKEKNGSAEKATRGVNLEHQLEDLSYVYYFPQRKDLIEGIDLFIKKYKTEMVVMIPHRHNLFERLFGKSNTRQMAYHTHIPLLALPENHKSIPAYLV